MVQRRAHILCFRFANTWTDIKRNKLCIRYWRKSPCDDMHWRQGECCIDSWHLWQCFNSCRCYDSTTNICSNKQYGFSLPFIWLACCTSLKRLLCGSKALELTWNMFSFSAPALSKSLEFSLYQSISNFQSRMHMKLCSARGIHCVLPSY